MTTVTRTSAETLVNTTTAGDQSNSAVAGLHDGGYVVVWEDANGPGGNISGKQFASGGETNGEFLVEHGYYDLRIMDPDVAVLSDGSYVTLFGYDGGSLLYRSYESTGYPKSDISFSIDRNFNKQSAVVGLSNGQFIAAYASNGAFGNHSSLRLNVGTSDLGNSGPLDRDPAIAAGENGFVAAWTTGNGDGSAGGIFFQRFANDGTSLGAVTPANVQYIGDQSQPDVAVLNDGRFVIAWASASPTDTGYDIRAQRFDADGRRTGAEFKINTTVTADQSDAQVAALADGGFVVVWTSAGQDGSGTGIYAQRYTATGARSGGEILVNAEWGFDQSQPSLAALDDGGFVVTWTGTDFRAQGGSGSGIFSRVFEAPRDFTSTTSAAIEIIEGTAGDDVIKVAPGSLTVGDAIYGGAGTDRLQLSAAGTVDLAALSAISGVEELYGTAGNDTVIVSQARLSEFKTVRLGGGTDTFQMLGSFALAAGLAVTNLKVDPGYTFGGTYSGNEYDQTITGNDVRNTLYGEGGNDTLIGGGGNDVLYGGTGNDTYRVETNGDSAREAVGEGIDTVLAASTFFLLDGSEIEVLKTQNRLGKGRIDLHGNAFAQALTGNNGDNRLDGRGGADTMTGLGGNDTYVVDDAGDRVIEANRGGTDTVRASVDFDLGGQYLENLVLTGTGNLRGFGNSLKNSLVGTNGDNRLDGRGGADTMTGLGGNDTYVVDDAGDVVIEAGGGGTDTVYARVSYTLAAGQAVEILRADAGETAITLTGNELSNTLFSGAAGDILAGGKGNDFFSVDDQGVKLVEARDAGNDTVYTSVSFSLVGQYIENLVMTGERALKATGNSLANTLVGNGAANILDGGTGADFLIGGGGSDSFAFTAALGSGVDRITDFSPSAAGNDDTILLSGTVFGMSQGALKDFTFKDLGVQGARLDASDRIVYDRTTGVLAYDADGSGSKAAVQFAALDNEAILTAADFKVV